MPVLLKLSIRVDHCYKWVFYCTFFYVLNKKIMAMTIFVVFFGQYSPQMF